MDTNTKDRLDKTISDIVALLTRFDRMAARASFSKHCRAKTRAMIFEAVEIGQASMANGAIKFDQPQYYAASRTRKSEQNRTKKRG